MLRLLFWFLARSTRDGVSEQSGGAPGRLDPTPAEGQGGGWVSACEYRRYDLDAERIPPGHLLRIPFIALNDVAGKLRFSVNQTGLGRRLDLRNLQNAASPNARQIRKAPSRFATQDLRFDQILIPATQSLRAARRSGRTRNSHLITRNTRNAPPEMRLDGLVDRYSHTDPLRRSGDQVLTTRELTLYLEAKPVP
jgi:hypothetical protein